MAARGWISLRYTPVQVRVGVAILLPMIVILLGAWALNLDPLRIDTGNRLLPPSASHPFGTDGLGRDVFVRVLEGGRRSLGIGVAVALISSMVGGVIGLGAGFLRRLEAPISAVLDGIMAIPSVLLAIALMAISYPSVETVVVALVVPEIPRTARLVRASVVTVRDQSFVEAAHVLGTSTVRTLTLHIVPNVMPVLIVQASHVFASAMLNEAVLGFLGAGTPPEIPTWGNVIAEGRGVILAAPWVVLLPGMTLAVAVVGGNLLGDGLRRLLDPRSAAR